MGLGMALGEPINTTFVLIHKNNVLINTHCVFIHATCVLIHEHFVLIHNLFVLIHQNLSARSPLQFPYGTHLSTGALRETTGDHGRP